MVRPIDDAQDDDAGQWAPGDSLLEDRRVRLRIRTPGVAWQRVMDDMVLLDVDRSVYHGLNDTGALVWEGLADERPVGDLIDRLAQAYPEDADAVARDLPVFLGALLRAGLIEVVGTAVPPAAGST